jgi:hypothetical protein
MGCGTFNPRPLEEALLRNKGQTLSDGTIRVTATVLSAEETIKVFDRDLYEKGIQPIWLEIANNDETRVWVPTVGVDPDYFSPLEVAYMHHAAFSKEANLKMDEYMYDHAIRGSIASGHSRSGFVFTNLDMGTKAFNVDVIGEDGEFRTFTFFIPVPGFRASHADVDWDRLYSKDEVTAFDDLQDLRKALENLPCCTTGKDGKRQGDPLNLVIIGSARALHRALIGSGWDETAGAEPEASSKDQASTTYAKQARYAPVTFQYLYGRRQDAAFRKSRKTADERNQLRLWLSPLLYEGKPVWVGQISREIKVRYLLNTYRIEPLLDEARLYLLQDLSYSQSLSKYGYVKGIGTVSMSEMERSLKGDPYFTDGLRIVLWVSRDPVSYSKVTILDWAFPPRMPAAIEKNM